MHQGPAAAWSRPRRLLPPPPPPAAGPDAAAGEQPPEQPPYAGVIPASDPPHTLWRTTVRLGGAEYHLGNYSSRAETAAAHDLGLLWIDCHDELSEEGM